MCNSETSNIMRYRLGEREKKYDLLTLPILFFLQYYYQSSLLRLRTGTFCPSTSSNNFPFSKPSPSWSSEYSSPHSTHRISSPRANPSVLLRPLIVQGPNRSTTPCVVCSRMCSSISSRISSACFAARTPLQQHYVPIQQSPLFHAFPRRIASSKAFFIVPSEHHSPTKP